MKIDLGILGTTGNSEAWWARELPEFGRTASEQYSEIRDNSTVVGGALFALESFFRRVPWTSRPAPKPDGPKGTWTEARANFWAGFLDQCVDDMSHTFPGFLAEVLTMLPYGWSYFEVIYKYRRGPDEQDPRYRSRYDDNRIGWRKLSLRPQNTLSRWEFDGDGGIQGMWQSTSKGEVFLPIQRSLHFRTTEAGNHPEGRSLLKNARRSYYYQKRLEEFEAIGVERNLTGIPHITVPAEFLTEDAPPEGKAMVNFLVQQGKALRRDEASVIVSPSETYIETVVDPITKASKPVQLNTGYKFDTIKSSGPLMDANPIITRYKRDVAVTLLASFLMLGIDGKGSLALSTDLTDLFELAGSGILDGVASTFNRFAVAQLMQLNGVPAELWPTLEHGGLSDSALRNLFSMVNDLLNSGGITADPNLENELREKAGLPEKAAAAPTEPQSSGGKNGADLSATEEGSAALIDFNFDV